MQMQMQSLLMESNANQNLSIKTIRNIFFSIKCYKVGENIRSKILAVDVYEASILFDSVLKYRRAETKYDIAWPYFYLFLVEGTLLKK